MASSVNLSENLRLIPMDMWLWSGLTFPYVFCPLYRWGNPRCTSPCKGQLTWFRLLYSNSPKLRKTNCGRKQSTSFLARGIVFASHLCNRNYRKKPRNISPKSFLCSHTRANKTFHFSCCTQVTLKSKTKRLDSTRKKMLPKLKTWSYNISLSVFFIIFFCL